MSRLMAGLAAWLGGTAAAVCLAWFGAGLVMHSAIASPAVPVLSPSALSPPAPAPPVTATLAPPVTASPPPAPASRRPSAKPSAQPPGQTRVYAMTGGRVTLQVTATSARLVTAVPDAGFAVQTWSGPQWLRVDFSSGPQVSSLIASWNGHAPDVSVTN